MPLTIDATVGGSSANSFVTLAEFTTHMESRLNSDAFDDATTDSQNRALGEATRYLSALAWQGRRVTTTQALSWPRDWARDPDSPNYDYFDTDEIPGRVKRGTFELAFEFLKAGTTDIATSDPSDGVEMKQIDVIVTRWFAPHERLKGLDRYPNVTREIGPLLESRGLMVPLVKG